MSSADFPGQSTSKLDPVLIFDLDGTILSINSYRLWVLYLLRGRFGGMKLAQRVLLSLSTARLLLASKLFVWEHTRAKQRMQLLWTNALSLDADQRALELLARSLASRVRPNCLSLLAHVQKQTTAAVLSTAAAGEYAHAAAKQLGFRHVLATSTLNEPIWLDNSGEEKRRRTLAYLAENAWHGRRRIFLTDHLSDLPLIRSCHLVLWFGKDEELDSVRTAAPETKAIPCGSLTDTQVMAIVAQQYERAP